MNLCKADFYYPNELVLNISPYCPPGRAIIYMYATTIIYAYNIKKIQNVW